MNNQLRSIKDLIDNVTLNQIEEISKQEAFENAKIAIMPDAHAGKGSCVGFTALVDEDKIIPNTIGVDIGCSVTAWKLNTNDIDFAKLDSVIKNNIPSGNNIRKETATIIEGSFLQLNIKEVCERIGKLNTFEYFLKSIGTLGGGNHFISIEGDDNEKWLVIHTGSRKFGHCICTYYQSLAKQRCKERYNRIKGNIDNIIQNVPAFNREMVKNKLKSINIINEPKSDYMFLEGLDAKNYISDMQVALTFAYYNHLAIQQTISQQMNWDIEDYIKTQHNYIEQLDDNKLMIRKGAVSAERWERFLVPLNMADGTLICEGKGNEAWNCSAPHGAGRIGSRADARKSIALEDYKKSMKAVYSSCVCNSTLDEAPMAYKNAEIIKEALEPTAEIIKQLKPFYNFKSK